LKTSTNTISETSRTSNGNFLTFSPQGVFFSISSSRFHDALKT